MTTGRGLRPAPLSFVGNGVRRAPVFLIEVLMIVVRFHQERWEPGAGADGTNRRQSGSQYVGIAVVGRKLPT